MWRGITLPDWKAQAQITPKIPVNQKILCKSGPVMSLHAVQLAAVALAFHLSRASQGM